MKAEDLITIVGKTVEIRELINKVPTWKGRYILREVITRLLHGEESIDKVDLDALLKELNLE